MKLYITETSPYARIVRIVILEKDLAERVELVSARTRIPDSPYYTINPSGRVPYLVPDDLVGLEGSSLICAYLDRIDGTPAFEPPEGRHGWELRRLEASARSLLDGLAVWNRELRFRPEHERSPGIIEHESRRSRRLVDLWEKQIQHPLLHDSLNLAQITLICALDLEILNPGFRWRPDHPGLTAWVDRLADRSSIAATRPPTASRAEP